MRTKNDRKDDATILVKLTKSATKRLDELRAETGASRTSYCRAKLLKALK